MTFEELEPPRLGEARRELVREMLLDAGAVTVGELQARFGVSPVTARRDLDELERRGVARRTHGGAVLPPVAALENSFHQRLIVATEAKTELAAAAFALLRPGESIFLDSSTTAYFLAMRIAEEGIRLTVATNSGPALQVLAARDDPSIELHAVGGTLRRLTGSYVGPVTVRNIRERFTDRCFLSVTGVTAGGVLTDADLLEAAVKQAMIEQAGETVLLLDDSKLDVRGRQAIAPVGATALVLAHGIGAEVAERLRSQGAQVEVIDPTAGASRRRRFVS
jgi:DeoR/GlpR family transcriptional regulator of sugar metabolism